MRADKNLVGNKKKGMEQSVAAIIPIYNTPAWMLEQCVCSVQNQTYPVAQILLMDDGSTDKDTLDCLETMHHIPAVQIERLPHGGISAARNAGLDRVSSDWFLFLDSDDYWEPDFVQSLVQAAKPETQIVFCGNRLVSYRGEKVIYSDPPRDVLLDEKRSPYFTCGTGSRLWNTAFVRSLGEQGHYPANCIMEDEVFSAFVIAAAKNIVCVEQYGYNVRSRDDSTCRTRSSFNKSGPEQLPVDAVRQGLQQVVPTGEWQKQVLYCRCLHSMMAASWIFCCYAAPAERRIVARQAATLIREALPNFPKTASSRAGKKLYSRGHRLAMSVYAAGVGLHMEVPMQALCTALARAYYRHKRIA